MLPEIWIEGFKKAIIWGRTVLEIIMKINTPDTPDAKRGYRARRYNSKKKKMMKKMMKKM